MVVGNEPLPTDVIGAVNAGQTRPLGFTNPVWLDADSDGTVKHSGAVPPMPTPYGKQTLAAILGAQAETRILETPLHAPLDCEPEDWPLWLQ